MANPQSGWSDFFDQTTYYTGPILTDQMVQDVEASFGYVLPPAYLQLLRVKNGGAPKRQCFPINGTSWSDNHVRAIAIFGVGGRWGIDSPEFGTRHMIAEGGFPDLGIIIAWTPTAGHDAVMLDYSQHGVAAEPRVTHVDAETGDILVLAETFEIFARGLVDCRPYESQREQELAAYKQSLRQT